MKKKILMFVMSACLFFSGNGQILYAAEDNVNVTAEAATAADMTKYDITISEYADTEFKHAYWNYSAETPQVVSFFDYQDNYNVVYEVDNNTINIQRYNSDMEYLQTINLTKRYPLWGNAICDSQGNYYIIWGQSDASETNTVVTCVSKYDYNGNLLGECPITGYESNPYKGEDGSYWGTKVPFASGNCSLAISNGVLACNYARTMYSGHQSNFVFYVNCETMERVLVNAFFKTVPYCSHSFDQRVVSTSDGGFLIANHGDAFSRSFLISKVSNNLRIEGEVKNFHFREGADRSYGYNETYAQLGNIVETDKAYVFCASSERTLSLDVAPTGGGYSGHSEARDLFVQFLKKDFSEHSGAEQYCVSGETRKTVGNRPTSAKTNLYLNGNEVNYGIIWLTDYEDTYYVNNPQMILTDEGKLVVLWEKLSYQTHQGNTYYAVLNEDGSFLQQPRLIENTYLTGNINPVCKDGNIYWTTKDSYGVYINCLDVDGLGDIFADVEKTDWFYPYVKYAYQHNFISGKGVSEDGKIIIDPENPLKRSEFAQILYSREGKPSVAYNISFKDVFGDEWYTDAVQWVAANGIAVGYDNENFGVEDSITREQLALMLYKYAKFKGYDIQARADITQFNDYKDVHDWSLEMVQWANAKGIMNGKGDILDPLGGATRAEAVTMLKGFIEAYE